MYDPKTKINIITRKTIIGGLQPGRVINVIACCGAFKTLVGRMINCKHPVRHKTIRLLFIQPKQLINSVVFCFMVAKYDQDQASTNNACGSQKDQPADLRPGQK